MAENETTPDHPHTVTLELIFRQGQRILRELDQSHEKQDEVIVRLGRLEREVAGLHGDLAGLSVRVDNLDRRVGRIERRLELIDDPAPTSAV
jgi:predicted nuclease with TOPRIM domain